MLTPAQLAAVKADIDSSGDLNIYPNNSDGSDAIAKLYNLPAVPTFNVWRTDAPVSAIYDAITWANFTPTDVADGTAIQTNRLLAIQTKQMNLQSMLQGKDRVDASKANFRAGLKDAVTALPSGVAGAVMSAGGVGGVTVLNALVRPATRIEKLLSTGNATTGAVAAGILGYEYGVSYQDIDAARA